MLLMIANRKKEAPMRDKFLSKGSSSKKHRVGILFGIPILLFICGIILITIASYNYIKYAYFLSRMFVQQNVNVSAKNTVSTGEKKIKFPTIGEEFGEIIIPSVNITCPVIHGDRDEDLLKAAGHYSGSRYPGQGGNVVLAGHRNSVFSNLKSIKKGDEIIFNTTYGKYIYVVSDINIKDGKDQSIVEPRDKEMLTLYTCYPFNYIGHAPTRFVVTCDLKSGTPLKELMLKAGEGK